MKRKIIVENLSFTYQGTTDKALKNVSLTMEEGQCVLLCGKSGCGKTTFTRLLNGLIPEYFKGEMQGRCSVFGLECGQTQIEQYVPLVGSVFQNPKTQYFNTNTTAELAFPCENMGVPTEEIRNRVVHCAERFGLENLLNRSIFELSGGEKQKIAFGAATMLSPSLLVLDEPTSNLDKHAIKELHDLLYQMKKAGVTIVLAEHRLAWVKDLADCYIFFENGEVKETYSAEEFLKLPDAALEKKGLRSHTLIRYQKLVQEKAELVCPREDSLFSMEGVTIGYHRKNPVYQVSSISLKRGEILGLMGQNGIGKSTMTKTMCGLLKPLHGQITWKGKKISAKELVRKSFLVMQDVNYQLFHDSVLEEVSMDGKDTDTCMKVLEKLGILHLADRHPMSLSGGQKQRVAIACAMVSSKELIFMDEPTSGLDRYHMMQVGGLLDALKKQGKTVVVITHDEELAADWCDRIYQMRGEENYAI